MIAPKYVYIAGCVIGLAFLKMLRNYFNGPIYYGKKDVKGKTIIVTGSNSGLGKETALDLLKNGATVIFACRNEKTTKEVIDSISDKEQRERAIFMKLDLCSIESTYNFATEFKKRFTTLDILVCNAGLMADTFVLTQDGIETSLESNHIAHKALTFLLLDTFDKKEGRIINLSSIGHRRSNYSVDELKRLEGNLEFKGEGDNYSLNKGLTQYGNSKLASIYFSQYLAEIFEKKYKHLKAVSLHPGAVNTEFSRFVGNFNFIFKILFYTFYPVYWFIFKDQNAGAQTSLALCYMDFDKLINGAYYVDLVPTETYPIGKDKEVRDEFMKYSWMLLDKITKDKFTIPRVEL